MYNFVMCVGDLCVQVSILRQLPIWYRIIMQCTMHLMQFRVAEYILVNIYPDGSAINWLFSCEWRLWKYIQYVQSCSCPHWTPKNKHPHGYTVVSTLKKRFHLHENTVPWGYFSCGLAQMIWCFVHSEFFFSAGDPKHACVWGLWHFFICCGELKNNTIHVNIKKKNYFCLE